LLAQNRAKSFIQRPARRFIVDRAGLAKRINDPFDNDSDLLAPKSGLT